MGTTQQNRELRRSRYGNISRNSTRHFRQYKLEGEQDYETALMCLFDDGYIDDDGNIAQVPESVTYGGFVLPNRTIQSFDPLEDHKCDKWQITVAWDSGQNDIEFLCEDDQFQFGIDISGQNRRVLFSKDCTLFYPGGERLFPNGGLIFDCNDEIGVDSVVPLKKYTETACFPENFVTKDWCLRAAVSIGTTNAFQFRDCDPCEMLFTGISARRTGLGLTSVWIIDFEWCISPNVIIDVPVFDPTAFDGMEPSTFEDAFTLSAIALGGHDRLIPVRCHNFPLPDFPRIEITAVSGWKQHRIFDKVDWATELGI